MAKNSAGLLMYRKKTALELFLVHPGGPFFRNKDDGAWSIPKGEYAPNEDAELAARREFTEETGLIVPDVSLLSLGEVKQQGGKRILAWAFEGDCDPDKIDSNTFEMEWPPRSRRRTTFPEVDRAAFFSPEIARVKLNPAQAALVDRLETALAKDANASG